MASYIRSVLSSSDAQSLYRILTFDCDSPQNDKVTEAPTIPESAPTGGSRGELDALWGRILFLESRVAQLEAMRPWTAEQRAYVAWWLGLAEKAEFEIRLPSATDCTAASVDEEWIEHEMMPMLNKELSGVSASGLYLKLTDRHEAQISIEVLRKRFL